MHSPPQWKADAMSDEQTQTTPPPTRPQAESTEDRSSKSWAERRGKREGPDYSGLAQRIPMDPHQSNA